MDIKKPMKQEALDALNNSEVCTICVPSAFLFEVASVTINRDGRMYAKFGDWTFSKKDLYAISIICKYIADNLEE